MSKRTVTDFEIHPGYDWTKSTKDNYQADGKDQLGPYAAIRSTILFAVHGCYIPRRQQLQDKLIKEVIATGPRCEHPWVVFSAGSFFAGKSFVILWMQEQGFFSLPDLVWTDPDKFRTKLPEWDRYLEHDSQKAGIMTHVEAGTCALIAQWEAMRQGRHLFIDGSLQRFPRQSEFFAEIRAAHPQCRIAIIHIRTSWATCVERAAKPREGGRATSTDCLQRSFDNVRASVVKLEEMADLVVHIDNDGGTPQLAGVVVSGRARPTSWNEVRSLLGSSEYRNHMCHSRLIPAVSLVFLLGVALMKRRTWRFHNMRRRALRLHS